ncbi:translation initiation factor IF-2-like [Vidua chalybeata]|uniref:translation initiation factor IF-2-like n=1 Tax=Vidua chalybeata TaxID=81927 RepID=UPI0023A8D1AE|nr:translation initiation factor IF-2-like [Vidua chalybeata]
MEESPGGRSPAFSGEEDAENRRVSSGSLVLPSCPRGPGDPAKSLQGSPDPAESPRGGGSDPRQSPGRGGAARRGGTGSAARPCGGKKKAEGGGEYKKRSSSAGAVCPGGAGEPRERSLSSGAGPRGGGGRRAPSPRLLGRAGRRRPSPGLCSARRGRSPAIPGAADTQGRGGRRRCCCCRWRSRCREAPAGASPPLSGASVGGCPAAASCGGGSLSAGPPWPERERIRLPAQLSVWKRGLVSSTGFRVAAPPSFEDLSSLLYIMHFGIWFISPGMFITINPSVGSQHKCRTSFVQ